MSTAHEGPLVDLIAGARPNFIMFAPIVRALEANRQQGGTLRWRLMHTGQHNDEKMSGEFLRQLGIPQTVTMGTNPLIGSNPAVLAPAVAPLFEGVWKKGTVPSLWDGRTGERIVGVLARLLAA